MIKSDCSSTRSRVESTTRAVPGWGGPRDAWLADLVESADDAVIGTTLDGRVVSWNSGAERLYGHTAEEMLGRPMAVLIPAEQLGELPALHARLARGGRVNPRETIRVRKDGTLVDVSLTVSPVLDRRGRSVGCSVIARDVSARRRAQKAVAGSKERFGAVFQGSPAMIVLTSVDGRVLDVSRAFLEMTGFSREELVGQPAEKVRPLWPADRRADVIERLHRDGTVQNIPAQIRTRSGELRDLVFSVALVTVGGETLVAGAAADVSPLRATERQLEESLKQLQRLSAEQERLIRRLVEVQEAERRRIAADMHDDTLQVLGAVNVTLHRLRPRFGEQAAVEALDELEGAVQLAMTRLRELLFNLHPGVLDREGIVPAVQASLERLGRETGISTCLQGSLTREPTPERRTALYRIVQEALVNVRKHAHADRVEVSMTEERGGLLITIRDDGVGFSLGEGMRPDSLGLVSMRERAEMLGGRLDVDTAPGCGVTVRVWAEPVDPRS